MSIYFLSFILEVAKYWLGYKVCFQVEFKKKWISVICLLMYGVIFRILDLNNNTAHLLMFLEVIIVLYITVEEKLLTKTLHIILLMCIILSVDEILGVIVAELYSLNSGKFPEEAVEYIVSSFISFTIIFLIQIFAKKIPIVKKENFRSIIRKSIEIWVVIMAVSMLIAVSGLLYFRTYLEDKRLIVFITMISILAYLGVCVLTVFMIYIKHNNSNLEVNIMIQKELKKMQKKFYENLLEKEEETKKFRHDIIHHLICMEDLARKEGGENTRNYILKMQDKIVDIQNKSFHTGNDILDTLLSYYASCFEKDITIRVSGKCVYPVKIDDVEMCIIFSNLLQNGVEALEKGQDSEKLLSINIQQGEHYVQIQIKNRIVTEKIQNEEFQTTKKEKKNHGFGLKNVIETVQKNEGRIDLLRENGEFIVTVILKI